MDELMAVSGRESSATALSNATLSDLPKNVTLPEYDRSEMTPGIVHIGVGNFHRAHLAWYVHRLMQIGGAADWAIIGAGVRENDIATREKLQQQDYLSTLIELDPLGGQATEIIGAMLEFLPVEADNKSLIQAMADPRIRIVSTTVTEGGYYLDPETRGLDITHPDILHDAENPLHPRTAFGAMVAALRVRRDKGFGPFTGLCCDNLQGNGAILRQSVTDLARLSDQRLANWIDQHCSFPNSMVDCIVPATGPVERDLAKSLGIDDAVPVTHENFRQWVVEDTFCAGRPDWDLVGVEFSDCVHQHETQKIRMLNGGHQIIANVAEILGFDTISQSISDPLIHALFSKVQKQEIIPHVAALPGMTVLEYLDLIDRRFSNDAIIDTIRRVAFDGSARHVGFILPSVRDGLATGDCVEGLALVEAAWARMCEGTRENGSHIEPNDPIWETLNEAAIAARKTPSAWLEMHHIYGDLAAHDRFASAFEKWLVSIYKDGTEATIRRYLEQS
jgi:mannitol 2-dehydrogenase